MFKYQKYKTMFIIEKINNVIINFLMMHHIKIVNNVREHKWTVNTHLIQ